MSVVLPLPLGPMTARISPSRKERLTRSTAVRPPKRRTRDVQLRMKSPAGTPAVAGAAPVPAATGQDPPASPVVDNVSAETLVFLLFHLMRRSISITRIFCYPRFPGKVGVLDAEHTSCRLGGAMATVQLSVLDLVPIGTGSSSRQALAHMLELAQLAEELGYVRFWLAEHHGMPSIASSSPEILIARVAAATRRIRVGAGGIMLPNHAPLRVAEAFHTLNALFPGRIDLGVGRAPGTDPVTSAALRPFD